MSSVLNGIGPIIDDFFGVGAIGRSSPHYRHKKSCLTLSENPLRDGDGTGLIAKISQRIETNWRRSKATYSKPPSRKNWHLRCQNNIDPCNTSPEVILERRIIRLLDREWWNQLPTSSGLVGGDFDKARNIDLVHKLDDGQYEFVELKVNSDTPLYATMEILIYGCLYLFSRQHRTELNYDSSKELLNLSSIHLRVLAPCSYYAPDQHQPDRLYNLAWLEELVNDGLQEYLTDNTGLDLMMDFRFDAFPHDFTRHSIHRDMSDKTIEMAVRNRCPLYSRP